ncbi:MAG: PAS domain S-box protein, partial [Desulfatibacillaceae bacterium]|nr:PAS domain S-box protein [Desulfatibacillaceae bacterium]
MNNASLLLIALAAITASMGIYHLFVYERVRKRREHFIFGLMCLAMALYDSASAGLYSAASVEAGAVWQTGRFAAVSLFAVAFVWFVADYTRTRTGLWVRALSAGLALFGLAGSIFPYPLVVVPHNSAIKNVSLPFGVSITYHEAALGLLCYIQGAFFAAACIWAIIRIFKYRKSFPGARANRLAVAMGLLIVAMSNDALVAMGFLANVYLFEYAYLGMLLLMGYSLVDDIVRATEMEASLEESLRRYRLLAQHSRDVIWTADLNLKINYCSPSVYHLRGYTAEETLSQPLKTVLTKDSYNRIMEIFHNLLGQIGTNPEDLPGTMTLEAEYTTKGGGAVWAEVTAAFTRDDKDNITGIVGITRDISRRKEMEMELQARQAHLSAIFEAADSVAFITMDMNRQDPKITGFSPGASKLLGYSQDEVIDRPAAMLHVADEWEDLFGATNYFDKDEALSREVTLLGKSGEQIPALVTIKTMIDATGRRTGALEVAVDLAQLKAAQSALVASQEKYRLILEGIDEGYYETDISGNITFFNPALSKMMGYPPEELMGLNNRLYTTKETSRRMYDIFNQVFRTGRGVTVSDYEIFCKDGSKKTLELSTALLKDEQGRAAGFRGIVRDATARLLAQQERERLAARHEQAQKMEALGTLAGGIAHDFNNLLMGLQGNVSLMLLGTEKAHPHFERLNNMEEHIRAAERLTRQLLGFARGSSFEVKPTDINALVERAVRLFGRTKKEIPIHTSFTPNVWTVEVDSGQIEQVLLNLFVNAWQAMPLGGDIFITTQNNLLDEQTASSLELEPGPFVRLLVRDTGVGMDGESVRRVFDPFFTTKDRGRGTGLGLATAYGIIRSHKGRISVESSPGEGTLFVIYLPASQRTPVIEEKPMLQAVKGTETILLVDDEERVLEINREMLSVLGYKVLVAKGGQEAIKVYQQHKDEIALVLLDMIMPDLMGGETYKRLKQQHPGVRVLLCSGYTADYQAAEILKDGCHGFIQKPFDLVELSHKIRQILDKAGVCQT